MSEWIKIEKDNPPKPGTVAYLAIKDQNNGKIISTAVPLFCAGEIWFKYGTGLPVSQEKIVAYAPVTEPKPYGTIGNGYGYYFRMIRGDSAITYGFAAQSAFMAGRGYKTTERAAEAAKRMMRLDDSEGYPCDECLVLDGTGTVVKCLRAKRETD